MLLAALIPLLIFSSITSIQNEKFLRDQTGSLPSVVATGTGPFVQVYNSTTGQTTVADIGSVIMLDATSVASSDGNTKVETDVTANTIDFTA